MSREERPPQEGAAAHATGASQACAESQRLQACLDRLRHADPEFLRGEPLEVQSASDLAGRSTTARFARIIASSTGSQPLAILKISPPGPGIERARRERDLLRTAGSRLGVRVPRLLGFCEDEAIGMVLALEPLAGRPLPFAPCDEQTARSILRVLARLHRTWRCTPPLVGPLPIWGSGTHGSAHPHRRRARRLQRRLTNVMLTFADGLSPERRETLEGIAARFELTLENAARWPRTFIHGDLHPGNILIMPSGEIALLDWQSASLGSGLLDAVRLLWEWSPAGRDRALMRDLIETWAEESAEPGGPRSALARLDAAIDLTIAGIISGAPLNEQRDPAIEQLLRRVVTGTFAPS